MRGIAGKICFFGRGVRFKAVRIGYLSKIMLILALCFAAAPRLNAQQSIEFSQYMLNLSGVTPSAVGQNGMINVLGTFRSQYAGSNVKDMPITFDIMADIGFNIAKTKHGAGIRFYDNMAGAFTFQNVDLNYAYHLPLFDGYLSMGVGISFTTLSADNKKLDTLNSSESGGYHNGSDPVISNLGNDFKMDLAVGVQFKNPKWYAAISLANILGPSYELSDNMKFKKNRTLRILGGYDFTFNNPLFKLKASAMVSTDFASWLGSINANLEYKESYWGGIGYRIDGAVVFMAGVRIINGLVIAYSYDLPTSKLIRSAGSHEVLLSYSFSVDFSKKNKYKSIRYL